LRKKGTDAVVVATGWQGHVIDPPAYPIVQLYEAWNKPEKAKKWWAKLPQTEVKAE
jgi:hypothetical protein